ncbi:MAG: AEC family transporter [Lentisphaerae bacterium]|nr:AEC family transporter [Lentisphaerota bacterium]
MTGDIILAIAQIFGVCFIGWLAARFGYLNEHDVSRWSRLMIDFLFPLLVFQSIVRGFDAHRLGELWMLPALGLGIVVIGALCGIPLRATVKSRDPDIRNTFHHFCASNNYGFLPVIIIQNLWGATGMANLFVLNLGSTIGYWTLGVALLGGHNLRATARHIISPTLIALALALIVSLTGLSHVFPELLLRVCESAGSAAVPGMLMLGGATLYPLPTLSDRRDLAWLTLVRLVLIPAITILALIALPLSADVRHVAIIVALMPVPISSMVLARRYGGSPRFAAQAAVVTTLAAIVTVPLAVVLLRAALAP